MDFKLFLEEFIDGARIKPHFGPQTYLEIHRNPSRRDLGRNPNGTRGLILPSGNLYILKTKDEDPLGVIHLDLIKVLRDRKALKVPKSFDPQKQGYESQLKNFLAVVYEYDKDHNLVWRHSESYDRETDKQIDNLRRYVGAYIPRAEKKNPQFEFSPEVTE